MIQWFQKLTGEILRLPTMSFVPAVILLLVPTASYSNSAITDPTIFDAYRSCTGYRAFLNGQPFTASNPDCFKPERVIFSNHKKGDKDFVDAFARSFGDPSGIGFLAELQIARLQSDREEVFFWPTMQTGRYITACSAREMPPEH